MLPLPPLSCCPQTREFQVQSTQREREREHRGEGGQDVWQQWKLYLWEMIKYRTSAACLLSMFFSDIFLGSRSTWASKFSLGEREKKLKTELRMLMLAHKQKTARWITRAGKRFSKNSQILTETTIIQVSWGFFFLLTLSLSSHPFFRCVCCAANHISLCIALLSL